MTKDEALAFDLALEALLDSIDDVRDCLNQSLPHAGYARYDRRIEAYREQLAKHEQAITAIKQARALDKMAENARELGLDYEPVAPVREDWGPGPHEYHSLPPAAPVQEPDYKNLFEQMCQQHDMVVDKLKAAQRQWQSLTDEEITALKRNGERYISSQDFARAIEAKLKELNK